MIRSYIPVKASFNPSSPSWQISTEYFSFNNLFLIASAKLYSSSTIKIKYIIT